MIFSTSYKLQATSYQQGQAVIVAVIFLVLLSVVIITGFATPLTRELKNVRASLNSRQAYFVAEAGLEDAIYRIKNNLNYDTNYTLTIGSASVGITTASTGNTRTVEGVGGIFGHQRLISVEMDLSEVGADLFYGVQVSDGGLYMKGPSTVSGSVYSNGDIVCESGACNITGDAIVAGGLNTSPSVEWTIQNADFAFASTSGSRDIAQSFTATVAGALNKVSVYLGKTGNPSSNLTLWITTDNSGKPDTTELTSETISYSSVGLTPSWIDVAITSPPTLANGEKYWIVLDYGSNSGVNYWNWRRDTVTDYANNTGKYTGACCSGNPAWTDIGDDLAFRVWIGGTITKIEDMIIGDDETGTGHANSFIDTEIHGANCPNEYCIVSNPPRAELPISDGVIQDWRDDAVLGDIIDGDHLIDTTGPFGPKKVNGNLTIDVGNDEILTIAGIIWVTGDLIFSCGANGSLIELDPGYGSNSGVIVVDGKVTVGNNCTFDGSGETDSYLMVLSAKEETNRDDPVMIINNNSDGVVYYASKGWIDFNNGAGAKEVTGYGISMKNGSSVTYEQGLANINFTSGPGGAFAIINWEEIE
ncbi:MAG: pilus assembly PilX N-terminal domain-containing protein [Candidatus Vogelbacteria bacterium]